MNIALTIVTTPALFKAGFYLVSDSTISLKTSTPSKHTVEANN